MPRSHPTAEPPRSPLRYPHERHPLHHHLATPPRKPVRSKGSPWTVHGSEKDRANVAYATVVERVPELKVYDGFVLAYSVFADGELHPHQTGFYRVSDTLVAVFDINFPEREENVTPDYLHTLMSLAVGDDQLVTVPIAAHNTVREWVDTYYGSDCPNACAAYVKRWESWAGTRKRPGSLRDEVLDLFIPRYRPPVAFRSKPRSKPY